MSYLTEKLAKPAIVFLADDDTENHSTFLSCIFNGIPDMMALE